MQERSTHSLVTALAMQGGCGEMAQIVSLKKCLDERVSEKAVERGIAVGKALDSLLEVFEASSNAAS